MAPHIKWFSSLLPCTCYVLIDHIVSGYLIIQAYGTSYSNVLKLRSSQRVTSFWLAMACDYK